MRSTLVEEHAAFLVDQGLQKLQFGFGQLNLCSECAHGSVPDAQIVVGNEKLPCGANEFRGLLKTFVLGTLQELGDIEQYDEPAHKLADSGDVAGFAVGEEIAGRLDFGRRNLQDFGSGVDDEADKFVFEFDDQDAVFLIGTNLRLAKTLSKIHHLNNLGAQIDDTFYGFRCAGYGGDFRHANNFTHRANANSVRFVPDAKTHDLDIFFHGGVFRRPMNARRRIPSPFRGEPRGGDV